MRFTERFNEVVKASPLAQREIAERLGVNPSFISQMKKGKNLPNITMLYNICRILDVSADYLLGLTDNY